MVTLSKDVVFPHLVHLTAETVFFQAWVGNNIAYAEATVANE